MDDEQYVDEQRIEYGQDELSQRLLAEGLYLEGVLRVLDLGLEVFPCGADKQPLTKHGFQDASGDREQVKEWWANNPDAWVGAAIPAFTVIVDVDPRNGGDATMKALEAELGALPRTKTVRTVSGGRHMYFSCPDPDALRGKAGAGVDLKRTGKGYVIVPPTPGYVALSAGQAVLPDAWLAKFAKPRRDDDPKPRESSGAKFFPFDTGTAYGKGALERGFARVAQAEPGGRNDALNKEAFSFGQLVAGGELDETAARDTLARAAEVAGLEDEETLRTIESGFAAGLEEPREAPPRDEPKQQRDDGEPPPDTEMWLDWAGDPTPYDWLLKPVLPKGAFVLVYGPTEASKSIVFNWVGAQLSCRGRKVTVYSLENGERVDRERLRRLQPCSDYFRLSTRELDLADPAQVEALIARERDWGAELVVLDTYSHAFQSRDDDGNARAIAFAQVVRRVMREVGCAVVVLDHTGFFHDEPRDASAKRQQCDVAILMGKVGTWQPGQDAGFLMQNRKASRYANPFSLEGKVHDAKDGGLAIVWSASSQAQLEWLVQS